MGNVSESGVGFFTTRKCLDVSLFTYDFVHNSCRWCEILFQPPISSSSQNPGESNGFIKRFVSPLHQHQLSKRRCSDSTVIYIYSCQTKLNLQLLELQMARLHVLYISNDFKRWSVKINFLTLDVAKDATTIFFLSLWRHTKRERALDFRCRSGHLFFFLKSFPFRK